MRSWRRDIFVWTDATGSENYECGSPKDQDHSYQAGHLIAGLLHAPNELCSTHQSIHSKASVFFRVSISSDGTFSKLVLFCWYPFKSQASPLEAKTSYVKTTKVWLYPRPFFPRADPVKRPSNVRSTNQGNAENRRDRLVLIYLKLENHHFHRQPFETSFSPRNDRCRYRHLDIAKNID